jgi:hypothetical protein
MDNQKSFFNIKHSEKEIKRRKNGIGFAENKRNKVFLQRKEKTPPNLPS